VISFRLPGGVGLEEVPAVGSGRRVAGAIVNLRTSTATSDVATLAGWAVARGFELEGLALSRPSLEDVYLDLVGQAVDAADDRDASRAGAMP